MTVAGRSPRQRERKPYPRPDGRGPIEARRYPAVTMKSNHGYPRPDGRGPIEAPAVLWTCRRGRGRPSIRDLTVAAPLKHPLGRIAVAESLRSGPAIRDLTVAAPLKQAACSTAAVPGNSYPRPDGRGPIEATRSSVTKQ